MASLSIICLAHGPGERVAALLRHLRPVADELLVLADSRVRNDRLGAYATVADRLIRYEFAMPIERVYAYAHAQCSGKWAMRVDEDETLSADLIEAIPRLISRRDVVQYCVPRRWCFGSARSYIDEVPWTPDYQVRLVRNDPATLWFPGTMHTAAGYRSPACWLTEPMYHLPLLLDPLEQRRVRVRRYESEAPGLMSHGGGQVNDMYLPEGRGELRLAEVPVQDAAAMSSILSAKPVAPEHVDPTQLPLADRAAIDAMWAGRPLAEEDYVSGVEVIGSVASCRPGERRVIVTRVTNRGGATWPWRADQPPLIRVGIRVRDASSGLEAVPEQRGSLPCRVVPGDSTIVPLEVCMPESPGQYMLEIDLVHEHVRWFGQPASTAVVVDADHARRGPCNVDG